MQNIDYDLRSVQEARDLARLGQIATEKIAGYNEEQIDKIIRNMVRVAEENAVSLAQMAVEETGFGKVADLQEPYGFDYVVRRHQGHEDYRDNKRRPGGQDDGRSRSCRTSDGYRSIY